MKIKFALPLFLFCLTSIAQNFVSEYKTIDLQKCAHYEQHENGETAECLGSDDVILHLSSSDWTNLSIQYRSRVYTTWDDLVNVGSFTSIGGTNQVAEFLIEPLPSGRKQVHSVIIRVRGIDPISQQHKSELLVFGFTVTGVCFRGKSISNEEARKIAGSSLCKHQLNSNPVATTQNQTSSYNNLDLGELVTVKKQAYIRSVTMLTSNVRVDNSEDKITLENEAKLAKGVFEIQITYCAHKKVMAEFNTVGARKSKNVTLGGRYSTYSTTPMTLSYEIQVYKNVGLTDGCVLNTMTVKTMCDIKPGFGGAGCNFNVNNNQTIAIELFRNGYNNVMLLPN